MTTLFRNEKLSHEERERVFYAIVAIVGRPTTYLDIDCGDGWLVRAARQMSCKPALGVGSELDHDMGRKWATIVVHNVRQPFQLRDQFELVTALSDDIHPSNLGKYVAPGGHLVTLEQYIQSDIGLMQDQPSTRRLSDVLGSTSLRVYKCHD